MTETRESTTAVIIGAGVAGLTLGNFLLRNGIDCIVLEKHPRAYVEQRQRAGTIDGFVRMLREWGLEEVLAGNPIPESEGHFYIDGHAMPIDVDDDNNESLYCPQQVLVHNLTEVFLRDGGDLRYEAADVSPQNITTDRPVVRYRDADGSAKAIDCDFIAGCDGFHGVSRRSIPVSALTEYSPRVRIQLAQRPGRGANQPVRYGHPRAGPGRHDSPGPAGQPHLPAVLG